MSRYNFSHMQRVLILLAHSLKIPTQIPQIILGFHKNFPNYYQNWARTNTCHVITKIWLIQIFLISLPKLNYKIIPSLWKPISIYLVDKTQKAQPIYYKAQEKYLAIFVKAQVCTWQYFTKSENIIKSPNTTFGNILSKI